MATDVATTPWSAVLPQLTARDLAWLRRFRPTAERWEALGSQVARVLPKALLGLWPLTAPEAIVLRVALEGPVGAKRMLLLDQFPLRIGRGEGCPLQLPNAGVSTEHAEIRLELGQLSLMDLRSTNGTLLNGRDLIPLTPVGLGAGDRVEIGPFQIEVQSVAPAPRTGTLQSRATEPRPRAPETLFRLSHPSDRWVRVRLCGVTLFLQVKAPWIRACWQRVTTLDADDADVGPMEEGAAQFVLDQVARNLGRELRQPVELSSWLTPAEAQREAAGQDLWLQSEVLLQAADVEFVTTLGGPADETPPVPEPASWSELAFPASLCVGIIKLGLSEWRQVEPGDAVIPDAWWPTQWADDQAQELGPALLRIGRHSCSGQLMRSEAGVKLRLENPWQDAPGGDWPMAEDVPLDAEPLRVQDLPLQIAIELDRFPVTLGEARKWRAGEVLNLRQGPSDPVRLVLETGLQRRVLAEGRVVVVNGKLGVEILRILTTFEDAAPRS